jgi:quercetin dioxygenase-like cupin family protein
MAEPLHVRGASLEWKRVYPGIGRIALRDDADTGAQTLLFRLDAGATYPEHDHPTGEDIYVLEGDMQIGDVSLVKGDYYRTPPGGRNSNSSKNGCTVLVVTWPRTKSRTT